MDMDWGTNCIPVIQECRGILGCVFTGEGYMLMGIAAIIVIILLYRIAIK